MATTKKVARKAAGSAQKTKRSKDNPPSPTADAAAGGTHPNSLPNTTLKHTLITLLIASLGLVVAFALIWWQVVAQPAQAATELERQAHLSRYAQYFNGRIGEMRAMVETMAASDTVTTALLSYEPETQRTAGQALAAQNPFVERVDIFERGRANVDLNAAVPISYAALDLIRRAESQEFVGPEVSMNQQDYIYTARPIMNQGAAAGVLFVAFNKRYLSDALAHHEDIGNIKIQQRVGDSNSTTVLSWGNSDNLTPPLETSLFTPNWTLSVAVANAALLESAGTFKLVLPFVVCLAVLAGAIYLGFSRLVRRLGQDAQLLQSAMQRVRAGKKPTAPDYYFEPFSALSAELATLNVGAPGRKAARPAAARKAKSGAATNAAAQAETGDTRQSLRDATRASTAEESPIEDFLDLGGEGTQDNFGIEVNEEEASPTMSLDLDTGIFRAYDIRGITTENLTEEVVYWIGRAFAAQALSQGQERAAVGWDGRHSSVPLQQSLTRGLNEGGMDVLSIGQVPTPLLYYATYALDTGTGIMITGSHNPPEYNGLKMMIGGVTLAEDAIQQLLRRIQNNEFSEGSGTVEEVGLNDSYVDKVLDDVAIAQPLKVVVDCGNGVAGNIAPRMIEELGCEVIPLYCDVDGDFPNHHPDPAEPENLEDLITVVKDEQADLGLAFDGDGDRVGVVTKSGEIIWPDKLIMLFAQDIVGRNPGADIIYDVKCSRHLNSIISELGGRPIMWKTGHSHIKAKIKETGALLGGEFSGHICIAERWYGFDDALYSAARLLEILGSEDRDADEIFAQFPVTYTTPEIKIKTTEEAKFEIMRELEEKANFGAGTITSIDGIRVDFEDGWGLIRPSNTSPVLSLRFEADGPAALDRIQDEFQAQLTKIAPDLAFR